MLNSYPLPALSDPTPALVAESLRTREAPTSSWHYNSRPRSRGRWLLPAALSVGLHAGLLLGVGRAPKKATAIPLAPISTIRLTIPDTKELEEPEPVSDDDPPSPTDLATLVPMQADLPQIPKPTDFAQAINFSSLIERPDTSNLKVAVIPDNYRGGRAITERIGKIFELADLDRVPEPVLQHAPFYPTHMKRDGVTGQVHVRFVVDAEGRVTNPFVLESSNHGFDDAALSAVSKWRFRPGIKAGRKVATQMAVPIAFSITEINP